MPLLRSLLTRLPKRRWKRVCIYLVSFVLVVVAFDLVLAAYWRRITIGYDTTRITGPLTPDGRVDYTAAYNAALCAGVTRDNNAAVDLPPLFGDRIAGQSPVDDDYVWEDEVRRQWENDTEIAAATQAPWKAQDHPRVAQLLADNQNALNALVRAADKPRLAFPVQNTFDGQRMTIDIFRVLNIRPMTRALLCRAQLRLGQGDHEAFERDVTAAMQLAHLTAQVRTRDDQMLAMAINDLALRAINGAVTRDAVPEPIIRRFITKLARRNEIDGLAAALDLGERFIALDSVSLAAKKSPDFLLRVLWYKRATWHDSLSDFMCKAAAIHYEQALRGINKLFDRCVAAIQASDWPARHAAIVKLEDEITAARPINVFSVVVHPDRFFVALVFPSVRFSCEFMEQSHMNQRLTRVALALSLYHMTHHVYPEKLDQLQPECIAEVPLDDFISQPLHYTRKGNGYLLYSVGINGKDDGGRNKRTGGTKGEDDLAIEASGM